MKKPDVTRGKKKKVCVAVIIALALCPQSVFAAVEPDYSQEITPEMQAEGITGFSQDMEAEDNSGRIAITDQISYDSSQMMYVYPTDEGEVCANVLDGMLTQSAVIVQTDSAVTYGIYRESEVYESTNDDGSITEPGSYSVLIGKKGAQTRLFSFTIIGENTNEPEIYDLPDSCIATEETLDGESVLTDNRSLRLSEEGHYSISYQCVKNGLEYMLDFTVDRTAPKLTFSGVKKGKARGEVNIEGLKEGDTLSITKDGNKISSRTTLTQPGEYVVKATDAAGNSSLYSFYILFYLNTGGISFGLILLVAIIALGIYLYVSRKRLRIR